jgi:hypothetical protein
VSDGTPGESEPKMQRLRSEPRLQSEPLALPVAEVFGPQPVLPVLLHAGLWILIALPALYEMACLVSAVWGRIGYPYDLEWMEGGMLHHAQRIRDGSGIYVPPSVDFIPYLYTPLYPSLVALFGGWFGVTYTLGRTISVLSLIGIAIVSAKNFTYHRLGRRGPTWAGVALALGLFAAYYPVVDGWYDLVRGDTLFLFMVTAAIAALPKWARSEGPTSHAKVAAGAAILALAFYTKQTGIVYVLYGGVLVLIVAWRRVFTYAGTALVIGLGTYLILEHTTQGWFWTYASKIHRAHDFNMDRFWKSFSNILWRCELPGMPPYPAIGAAITLVLVIALAVVGVTWFKKRVLPPQVYPLLLWTSVYLVSIVVGAIGFGTEFAHFNAYMPAFLHGALAAGAAIPAMYACAPLLWGDRPRKELVATGSTVALALPLAITCITAAWSPSKFTPTAADVEAGDKLIEHIRKLDGEVWMPSHPWYLHLADKTPRVHRMGIKDVTWRQSRIVEGLDQSLSRHAFAALVLDSRDIQTYNEVPILAGNYRPALTLPADERPHVYSGAGAAYSYGGLSTPDSIWLPSLPKAPPAGAHVVFDFESPMWDAWKSTGAAWGKGPETSSVPGQDLVVGATGQRFATSMHGGDEAIGRLISPAFVIDGVRLTIRLAGEADAKKMRVELYVDDSPAPVATQSARPPGSDTLEQVSIDVEPWRGKTGKLVFVDDSQRGHLDVDDVWLWQTK